MGVNGLYGLSGSGLDIESMVKAGMLSKQNQYDKMYKKEVKNEWLKQGFNEIYTSLNTFKYTTLSDYKMQSNMNAMGAESSNTSAVKVTANGSAVAMSHNVTVNSMSSNAYLLTNGEIQHQAEPSTYSYDGVNYKTRTDNQDGTVTLTKSDGTTKAVSAANAKNVKPNYGITLSNVVLYSIEEAKDGEGKTKHDADGNTIYSIKYDKDSAAVEVNAKDTAIAFIVQDNNDDPATMVTDERLKQTVRYTFEDLAGGKTLNDLAADIKNLNTNVVASYDATNGAFSIYNKESGSDAAVKLTMGSMNNVQTGGDKLAAVLFNNLQLGKSADGYLGEAEKFYSGSQTRAEMKTIGTIDYANTEAGAARTGKLKDIVLKDIQVATQDDEDNPFVDDEGNPVEKYKITKSDGTTAFVGKEDTALNFKVKYGETEKEFSFTYSALAHDGVSGVVDLINNGFKDKGLTASYDEVNGFSLTGLGGSALTVTMGTGEDENHLTKEFFNRLKISETPFTDGSSVTVQPEISPSTGISGAEGSITIDGRTYTDVKDNRITVSGVTYSLLNKGDATVAVTQDTDKIIENVKKFVEDYNKILDDLTKKYNTKPSGDYEPLSKTQEASMTQEQIDKWTEKAKEGLFYHNDILRGLISDMRDAIMTPVQSVHSGYNSASAIGITSSNNQGHLELDVDKLKKALAADPDCVYEIFASDQDTYTDAKRNDRYEYMAKDDFNNRGIANRLYFNAITDGIKKVEDFAGVLPDSNDQSSLGLLITQLKDRMTNFKKMMDDYQTQLYKRYDALETMIASLNSQYNTLFGGQQ